MNDAKEMLGKLKKKDKGATKVLQIDNMILQKFYKHIVWSDYQRVSNIEIMLEMSC